LTHQARIALLEGQRRSAENLKVDLLRRVKMLEFALRQERSVCSCDHERVLTGRTKTFSTVGKGTINSIAPSRLVALQDEDRSSVRDDKEGSGSEGSEEGGAAFSASAQHFWLTSAGDRPKTNGSGGATKSSAISARAGPDTSPWKNIGGAPRDPKSRARSREYLKQSVLPLRTCGNRLMSEMPARDHLSHLSRRAQSYPGASPRLAA
jgi:striatin 1/3/4